MMFQKDHPRKRYPSDLTDEQWAIVAPLLPPPKSSSRGGRPREVDRREVLNTIFYLNRSGCQWDMLPHDLLPKSTVYDYFVQWRDDGTWAKVVTAWRERTRVAPRWGPERGYDGGKNIKGRKRHLLVDTLGLVLAVLITSARLDDGVAAPLLLSHVTPQDLPRLVTIFADQKYHNHALDAWMATHRTGWRIEVKARPEAIQGFTPLAKRWVIERTNAWNGRYRRNSKDYERSVESSTAMIQISHVHLMLNRLAPCDRPAFHYRKDAA
jgi:putative transposase